MCWPVELDYAGTMQAQARIWKTEGRSPRLVCSERNFSETFWYPKKTHRDVRVRGVDASWTVVLYPTSLQGWFRVPTPDIDSTRTAPHFRQGPARVPASALMGTLEWVQDRLLFSLEQLLAGSSLRQDQSVGLTSKPGNSPTINLESPPCFACCHAPLSSMLCGLLRI